MAATRNARAHWEGSLLEGAGQVNLESSGLGTFDVTWAARTEEAASGRTSPEELIAAAHSSCYNMALSHALATAGNPPEALDTAAAVTFQPGEGITGIKLAVNGKVPGLTAEEFASFAEDAKKNCPVSQALTGTTITLDVTFTA
ncbi:OsmC family peroxiredoxin [Kribbella sp. NBC_01245]|uniref:OsmC family peroxiredoxin n=1 Tax=Kribbella sp. NBC_01245 TaxID=2903578 RepID=UPI002E2D86CC|nr:OsmC family peroxiredoxin [Kribbella sp. NBC_01245]